LKKSDPRAANHVPEDISTAATPRNSAPY
jgi:hypothetical protein